MSHSKHVSLVRLSLTTPSLPQNARTCCTETIKYLIRISEPSGNPQPILRPSVCIFPSRLPSKSSLKNSFAMDLQIEATASPVDRYLDISFSSYASATSYYQYLTELKDLDPEFMRGHDWKFTKMSKTISMILPASIEIGHLLPYDVELVIQDVEQAEAWEMHMLLWKVTTPRRPLRGRLFSLSRPATMNDLDDRIKRTKESRVYAARYNESRTERQLSSRQSNLHIASATVGNENITMQRGYEQKGVMNWLTRYWKADN